MVIARQWHGKHVSAATNTHPTIEELLEAVSSMQSLPQLHAMLCFAMPMTKVSEQ
jgi:hypothetical protein